MKTKFILQYLNNENKFYETLNFGSNNQQYYQIRQWATLIMVSQQSSASYIYDKF